MTLSMYSGFSKAVCENGWKAAAEKALSLGCRYVETFDAIPPDAGKAIKNADEAAEVRSLLSSLGAGVACCSVFADVYNVPEAPAMLKEHVDIASALGSPFLHHTLLPWLSADEAVYGFDEAIERALDVAEDVTKYAEKKGVTCIYEPQGFYVNGIEKFGVFFNEMKRRCSNVGICGDIGNSFFADVTPLEFFRKYIGDIKHVHVKDFLKTPHAPEGKVEHYKLPDGTYLVSVPFGTGSCEVDACMDVLKNAGYNGIVSIETADIAPAVEYMKKFNF